jgi:hypothetical protein
MGFAASAALPANISPCLARLPARRSTDQKRSAGIYLPKSDKPTDLANCHNPSVFGLR